MNYIGAGIAAGLFGGAHFYMSQPPKDHQQFGTRYHQFQHTKGYLPYMMTGPTSGIVGTYTCMDVDTEKIYVIGGLRCSHCNVIASMHRVEGQSSDSLGISEGFCWTTSEFLKKV